MDTPEKIAEDAIEHTECRSIMMRQAQLFTTLALDCHCDCGADEARADLVARIRALIEASKAT